MFLTDENYFSKEAMQEYFSVSQFKEFVGSYGIPGCEAMALAKLRGEWSEKEKSTALLVGSYVDAHFTGTMHTFKAKNPQIFKKDGELRSVYYQANAIINRIERDSFFMACMAGEKQVIMTANIFGVPWKIKIDSYLQGFCITDLKIMESLRKKFWVRDLGHLSFVEYWGYNVQAAIYQRVVKENTGKNIPFLIAAASKEKEPDIEVIGFTQQDLDSAMEHVFKNVNRINDLKLGKIEPTRCENCDYCKATKVLKEPIHFSRLTEQA